MGEGHVQGMAHWYTGGDGLPDKYEYMYMKVIYLGHLMFRKKTCIISHSFTHWKAEMKYSNDRTK